MSAPADASRSDPYAALRYPEFRRLVASSFLLHFALLAQEVALGYELYRLTRDPLTLGLIGLAEAIPFIAIALVGGHYADRREKRNLMRGALVAIVLASAWLLWLSLEASRAALPQTLWLLAIYAAIVLIGFARGIFSPTASALKAFLVPRELFGNAATWSSAGWQVGAILGPVAGGLLHAAVGLPGALLVVIGLLACAALLVSGIQPRGVPPAPEAEDDLWASLKQGLAFVRDTPMISYAITLDLFSVLFGGVVAILPVFAADVLLVGPAQLGLLRAAPSVGGVLTLLLCAWYPPTRRAWRNLLLVVAGFGLATLLFALSKNFWLSMAALFLTGAFDSVSVVIRSTILQIYPPDHLRGRVQAVNSVFLSCSNEIGAFESGLAARLMGAVPSVIFGAGMTLAIVAGVWARSGKLFAVNLLNPDHDRKPAAVP
ncbi:MAG: MFS transporter [Stagnimonas sp.]|nr:MFS transporter [Stagnimonas sp.]